MPALWSMHYTFDLILSKNALHCSQALLAQCVMPRYIVDRLSNQVVPLHVLEASLVVCLKGWRSGPVKQAAGIKQAAVRQVHAVSAAGRWHLLKDEVFRCGVLGGRNTRHRQQVAFGRHSADFCTCENCCFH